MQHNGWDHALKVTADAKGLVGGLPQQDRAGVPDQPGPVGGDLQGTVPPVMLHGEERSSSGD